MQRLSLRIACLLIGLATISFSTSQIARAQPFPTRTVRLVVPFAPGGGTDVAARTLAARLTEIWKHPVVVENKLGAGSIIATDLVAKSPPDGYTILANVGLIVQNPSLHAKLPYDTFRDLRAVTMLTKEQLVLVVSTEISVTTLDEFIRAVKSAPGKFAFASYGTGSTSHLLQQQLNRQAGIDLLHVPYKGTAAALQALLSGEAQVAILNHGTAKSQVQAGRLRYLAVMGDKRSPFIPDVPTFEEQGLKGFTRYSWIGLFVPANTPNNIVERIATDVSHAALAPEVSARFREFGQEPGGGTSQEFEEIFLRDFEYYDAIIKRSGIRASD